MTLGGTGGVSYLDLNGFNVGVGGIATIGSNTRSVRNTAATDATLTLNVANGDTPSYAGNIDGTGTGLIHIVKSGLGTQTIVRPAGFTKDAGNVAVNQGTLDWRVKDSYGALAVNNTATLILSQTGTAASLAAASGTTTTCEVAIGDWTGTAGTAWPLITVTGDLAAPAGSTFNVKVTDTGIVNFTDANKSFVIASAAR